MTSEQLPERRPQKIDLNILPPEFLPKKASRLSILMVMVAIILACLVVYLVFYFGVWISRKIGLGGIRVMTRLMGLLLAVIAVQFMVSGLREVLKR